MLAKWTTGNIFTNIAFRAWIYYPHPPSTWTMGGFDSSMSWCKRRFSWNTVQVNTLRPWQNGRHFADDIFKCIFLNKNIWISIQISLKFVPKGPINNIPALVQIMACRRPGDKPLSELMMASLLTHICVTRPQWVKALSSNYTMQKPYM